MGNNHKNKKNKRNHKMIKIWKTIYNVFMENKGKIYTKMIELLGIALSIFSIFVALLVRQDTAELTKLSEKPVYYNIKVFPTEHIKAYETDKYVNLNLELVVDDFEIYKEKFLEVNYNSIFTHVTYYMVYDYDRKDIPTYYYKFDGLDDRAQAQMRLENECHIFVSSMNYSLTPNKKYCYVLIHTKTLSENHLDLIFFRYHPDEDNGLDFIEINNTLQVDITDIREEHFIGREYYTSVWAENEQEREDISFMFDVYEDLREKIKAQL